MSRSPSTPQPSEKKGQLKTLVFDPKVERKVIATIDALIQPVHAFRDLVSLRSALRSEEGWELLIIVERKEGKKVCETLLQSFPQLPERLQILVLYGKKYRHNRSCLEGGVAFLPLEESRLMAPMIRQFLLGLLYRKGFRKSVARIRELEKTIADIGKRYHSEQQEEQRALEMRETWFASMVHELRNPINGILGMTRLLQQSDLPPQERAYLRDLERSGQMLDRLVNDLLDLAKLESGKLELEQVDFDINEVLDQVAASVGPLAEEKGLRLIFDVGRNVPARVVGDPLRLAQVLINLAGNAVKFTERGEVVVRIIMKQMEEDRAELLFEVTDTGPGIEAEQLDRIFENFSQADRSVSRRHGGTGLGLAISKKLVEAMGGTIGVESAPGRGSRFHFTFPTRRRERRSYRLPSRDLMYKRVLILDENQSSAGALARMFRYFHYGTTIVSEGEELQKQLEESLFDLVIVDESRTGLFARYRDRLPECFTVLSYSHNSAVLSSGTQAAFDGLLEKPVTQRKVFQLILDLYEKRERQREREEGRELGERLRELPRKRRILVADDNTISQAVVMGLLDNTGLEVLLANDGEEALELLDENEVDLILMDMHMEKMSGEEAVREIRSHPRYDGIPILALTGDRMSEERVREMGMQGYLGKPIDVTQFYAMLERFLTRPSSSERSGYLMEDYGFNVSQGIDRAGGNYELYCQVIGNFLEVAEESCDEIHRDLLWKDAQILIKKVQLIQNAALSAHARKIHHRSTQLLEALRAEDREAMDRHCLALKEEIEFAKEGYAKAKIHYRERQKQARGYPQGTLPLFREKIARLLEAVSDRRPYHCEEILDELEGYWWDLEEALPIERIRRLFEKERYERLERYLVSLLDPNATEEEEKLLGIDPEWGI